MLWLNFKKICLILFNIEFKFPEKTKVFLVTSNNQEFFKKIIDKKFKIFNMDKLNFYILILLLIKKKIFSKDFYLNYLEIYLKFSNSKVFISTIDNNPIYWSLKKRIPTLKVVIIQNGWRFKRGDIFDNKSLISKKNYQVDYFFTFNSSISKLYSKYVKANFVEIGSYRNNLTPIKRNNKNNKILFISEFINLKKKFKNKSSIISNNEYFKPEIILLPVLKKICKRYNLNLEILPRTFSQSEYLFFKKYLGKDSWKFNNKIKNPYKYVDDANIVIFTSSTLGYEAIARKKKVLGFSCKIAPDFPNKKYSRSFAWPVYSHTKKGFFWSNKIDLKIFKKNFYSLIKMNKDDWDKKISRFKDDIMIYDRNNLKLRKIVFKVCKNI